eukprot:TRINITY_DN16186_c0_g1_i1.p1 TRINITY_DN16186_c0_g1~~TRINITY_DN16186_c0_g1_i1.p1  ORF type:complete len:784 (+),score=289.83 TRINITY_DN16186_c0_g1_i1:70-2352(+)
MRRAGALLCWALGARADLTLNVYGNTAMTGTAATRTVPDATRLDFPGDTPFSAEAVGTLTLVDGVTYSFTCDFGAATVGFAWVDDHLVCSSGAYSEQGKVVGVDTPLKKLSKAAVPVRVELYYSGGAPAVNVSVAWQGSDGAPVASVPTLDKLEVQRRALQRGLQTGWGPWMHNSLLDQAQLPSGATLTTALCKYSYKEGVGDCQTLARPDDGKTRVGRLAYDRSYGQYYLGWDSANVSFAFSAGPELRMRFEQVSGTDGAYAVVVTGRGGWNRAVSVSAGNGTLGLAPYGLPEVTVHATAPAALRDGAAPSIVLPLALGKPQGISTTTAMSLDAITKLIDSMRVKEETTYEKFGDLAEAKAAAQAGVMWNYIYTPAEAGPLCPVSRGWDFTNGKVNSDWGYVIFDWDNIFASYLLSLDAKEIAYSNLIQVIRSKTNAGFVPNFSAAQRKSSDRTEPPIGAKVLLEIYRKYKDDWLVELLFDDLLDWSNWFLSVRTLQPLGLICLGGSSMQNARYESGLDNSPMYDGQFWNSSTQQMGLYDVGMTSMFTMEAEALAELADAVGRSEGAALRQRAAAMRKLLLADLWDDVSGTFVNKFPNGSFYRRVTPTSFYPLLTKGPSAEQAESMMSKWMMNRTRFCITPNGDFAGNSDDCYWGLPSISADDPAFPPLGYWRGYVWGPMMQLTYWGLQRYDDVPSVRTARKALCKQMTALMLRQWGMHGHICENFGPHKDTPDCTGNKFYHWGALAGFISLIENGHYY